MLNEMICISPFLESGMLCSRVCLFVCLSAHGVTFGVRGKLSHGADRDRLGVPAPSYLHVSEPPGPVHDQQLPDEISVQREETRQAGGRRPGFEPSAEPGGTVERRQV